MDVGLLRKEGVEVDAKNLLDPDESSHEDWARDGPFSRDDGMGPEFQTRSLGPSNAFGRWFRQCAAPAVGSKV